MDDRAHQSAKEHLQKLRVPGMDQGAGDSATSHPKMDLENSHEEDLAALQACLAGLQIPDSFQNRGDAAHDGVDEWESDDASTESSEVEIQCSYPFGYLKRQTVYTCLTCNDPAKEGWQPAGICIGCRNACHQGHDVISLETRRSFRCDCGNKKFPQESPCILCPTKEDKNDKNIYNDNFKGTFCSCNCKESDCVVEDPLYQCVVCENWYHANHCNAKTQGIHENYTDLVCGHCTSKLDFLRYYEPFDPAAVVDETAIDEMIKYTEDESGDENGKNPESSPVTTLCLLDGLKKKDPYSSGQLWTLGWRSKLCRCTKCKEMYASLNVSFLLDRDDEVRRYFTPSEDEDDERAKICAAVLKFEQWLFKMTTEEREELFNAEPEVVKQKMKDHFTKSEEGDNTFKFTDDMIDHLFLAFKEYILDADGGAEYLDDFDMLNILPSKLHLLEGSSKEEEGGTNNDCEGAVGGVPASMNDDSMV